MVISVVETLCVSWSLACWFIEVRLKRSTEAEEEVEKLALIAAGERCKLGPYDILEILDLDGFFEVLSCGWEV